MYDTLNAQKDPYAICGRFAHSRRVIRAFVARYRINGYCSRVVNEMSSTVEKMIKEK